MIKGLERLYEASWEDVTEEQPDDTKTLVERMGEEISYSWWSDGVERFSISEDSGWMSLLDEYQLQRKLMLPADKISKDNYYSGWHHPTPYLDCRAILNIGLDPILAEEIAHLLSDSPLLHLALTGFISTERAWHQDSYLNPPDVWSRYVAAWIALDDISEDAGPFEFIPGSHNWPVLRREKIFALLPDEIKNRPDWPTITQDAIAQICERKIQEEGVRVEKFVPKKGEVLLWHSNLVHRGSSPNDPNLLRPALILHYSAVTARPDMQRIHRYKRGFYFEP